MENLALIDFKANLVNKCKKSVLYGFWGSVITIVLLVCIDFLPPQISQFVNTHTVTNQEKEAEKGSVAAQNENQKSDYKVNTDKEKDNSVEENDSIDTLESLIRQVFSICGALFILIFTIHITTIINKTRYGDY